MRFDALNSRRLIDQSTLEARLSDLLSREARLERHDAVVAALAPRQRRAAHRRRPAEARSRLSRR